MRTDVGVCVNKNIKKMWGKDGCTCMIHFLKNWTKKLKIGITIS